MDPTELIPTPDPVVPSPKEETPRRRLPLVCFVLYTLLGASLLLFREKLSSRQWVGIGLGIASVVALCVG